MRLACFMFDGAIREQGRVRIAKIREYFMGELIFQRTIEFVISEWSLSGQHCLILESEQRQ